MPTVPQRLRRRIVHECRRAWTRQLHTPSFAYKSREMQRIRAGMRELGMKDPAYLVDAKDDAHAWAEVMGFRTPRVYATVPHVGAVDWDRLGDEVVLKPARGTSGVGVHLLRRDGARWRELGSRRSLSSDEVVDGYRLLEERGVVSREILLEELVTDPAYPDDPPVDYKVMTFYGVVGLIEAKRCRPGSERDSWKVFDASWRSLRNPFNDYLTDESISPPAHADGILDLASRVSRAVPRPYLRIDLYEDRDGPLLGEVTPEPGGDIDVRRDVDVHLGRLWEEAEGRLRVRFARDGVLTPDGLAPDPSDLQPRS